MDVEDEEEVLPDEARGFEPPKEPITFSKQDIRIYTHPHFDWKDKSKWQNDPKGRTILVKEYKTKR